MHDSKLRRAVMEAPTDMLYDELAKRGMLGESVLRIELSRLDAAKYEKDSSIMPRMLHEYIKNVGQVLCEASIPRIHEVAHPDIMKRGWVIRTPLVTRQMELGHPPDLKNPDNPAPDLMVDPYPEPKPILLSLKGDNKG